MSEVCANTWPKVGVRTVCKHLAGSGVSTGVCTLLVALQLNVALYNRCTPLHLTRVATLLPLPS